MGAGGVCSERGEAVEVEAEAEVNAMLYEAGVEARVVFLFLKVGVLIVRMGRNGAAQACEQKS